MYSTFTYKSSVLDKQTFFYLYKDLKGNLFKLKENKLDLRCLDYLLFLFTKFESVYVSQIRIGNHLGVRRGCVNKIIGRLCELGFIQKTKHEKARTCLYKLNSLFFKLNLKWLVRLFPSMARLFQSWRTLSISNSYTLFKNIKKKRFFKTILGLFRGNTFTPEYETTFKRNMDKKSEESLNLEKVHSLLLSIGHGYRFNFKKCSPIKALVIQSFSLTPHGVIRVSLYQDEVVRLAYEKYGALNKDIVDDRFAFFLSICESIKKSLGLENLYSLKDALAFFKIKELRVMVGDSKRHQVITPFFVEYLSNTQKGEVLKLKNNDVHSLSFKPKKVSNMVEAISVARTHKFPKAELEQAEFARLRKILETEWKLALNRIEYCGYNPFRNAIVFSLEFGNLIDNIPGLGRGLSVAQSLIVIRRAAILSLRTFLKDHLNEYFLSIEKKERLQRESFEANRQEWYD